MAKGERTLTPKEGDIVTVDAIEWIDPVWEFDNPCVVLRPVYQEFETQHAESAIESVMLDAIAGGARDEEPLRWNPATLKRRFREALNGAEFPERQYTATRVTFVIYRDAEGLMFREKSNDD